MRYLVFLMNIPRRVLKIPILNTIDIISCLTGQLILVACKTNGLSFFQVVTKLGLRVTRIKLRPTALNRVELYSRIFIP